MADYTPTSEDVREAWVEFSCLTLMRDTLVVKTKSEAESEFARWLAAHDAQVRAEALREAAIDFAEGGWSDAFEAGQVTDDESAARATEAWLNRRADRIARDGGERDE